MIAFLIAGSLKIAGNAVEWISDLDVIEWEDTVGDALGDLDVLFDEDEVHISVKEDEVTFTDKNGNQLIHVDGDKSAVDVNLKDIKALLDKYNIQYDDTVSDEEIEREIQQGIKDALEDLQDEYDEE